MGIVQRAFVGVVLGALLLVNFMNVLVLGAANGPSGHLAWLTHDLFGFELRFPPDPVFWCLLTAALIVLATAFEATSWSLAPVYKRRLFSAFGLQRIGLHAGMLELSEAKEHWEYIRAGPTPGGESPTRSERAGFFDGEEGDGTELVLCCAANIVGADRAPTGRRAVSFSVSRSVVGGPEVGWVAGDTYLARMGRRRLWDINGPAIVGVSGAAVSPAMGRQSLGPIGSVLAMLNVRLGAWLLHPQWVGNMDVKATPTWTHVPGWPWFLREVVRRYRSEAPYLYVTDGGHWEPIEASVVTSPRVRSPAKTEWPSPTGQCATPQHSVGRILRILTIKRILRSAAHAARPPPMNPAGIAAARVRGLRRAIMDSWVSSMS